MKNFFLLAAATSIQTIQIQSGVDPTVLSERSYSYPGQSNRSPYLEKVARDLSEKLHSNHPDEDQPEEMDKILCMFEAKQGSKEWERLGCDKWPELIQDVIDPQATAKAYAQAIALAEAAEKERLADEAKAKKLAEDKAAEEAKALKAEQERLAAVAAAKKAQEEAEEQERLRQVALAEQAAADKAAAEAKAKKDEEERLAAEAAAKAIADEQARLAAIPYPTLPEMIHPHPTDSIDNGGWTKVRHTPGGSRWGPWNDYLAGSAVHGNAQDDNQHWTVQFDNLSWTEMLFTTGDMTQWMVMARNDAIGSFYANSQRQVKSSSQSSSPYVARMYRRQGVVEDPWISILDHGSQTVIYGEGNSSGWNWLINNHNGADVYIR